ncbi:hypothetical protein Tco_1021056, partial [Tanacetum coccineum]
MEVEDAVPTHPMPSAKPETMPSAKPRLCLCSGRSKKIEKTIISKRKADEEAAAKAAAEEQDAIRKSNEKTTKKKIKEAKKEARKKLAKKKQLERDTEENVSDNEEYDYQSVDVDNKEKTDEEAAKRKAELLAELQAIETRLEKKAKDEAQNEDNDVNVNENADEADNEEDENNEEDAANNEEDDENNEDDDDDNQEDAENEEEAVIDWSSLWVARFSCVTACSRKSKSETLYAAVCRKQEDRSWNTTTMRKRIKMETETRRLGKLEHHGEFNHEEEQDGINVYKGLDVYVPPINDKEPETKEEYYEKIILKFDIISDERSELVRTLRNGVKKFEDDQMMIDFCKQYRELFNDNEFKLYEYSKDDDSEGETDGDNEDNNHDDDGAPTADANKKKESENQTKERNKEEIDKQTEARNLQRYKVRILKQIYPAKRSLTSISTPEKEWETISSKIVAL